jgi:hypothetical protein
MTKLGRGGAEIERAWAARPPVLEPAKPEGFQLNTPVGQRPRSGCAARSKHNLWLSSIRSSKKLFP